MKKIIPVIMVCLTIAACNNTGDKNQSSVKVYETDSTVKATDPNDAAGSSGRNDTATTPMQEKAALKVKQTQTVPILQVQADQRKIPAIKIPKQKIPAKLQNLK